MTNQKRVRKTPEERRADVHGAARSIALESGLSAVTQRAVAERVGVAPALITHYVSRMELLVAEVFRDIAQEELASVRATVEAVEGDEVEQVLTLLRELIHDFRRDVALVWLDGWSLSRRNDELAGVLVEEARAWEEFVAGIFARGDAARAARARALRRRRDRRAERPVGGVGGLRGRDRALRRRDGRGAAADPGRRRAEDRLVLII